MQRLVAGLVFGSCASTLIASTASAGLTGETVHLSHVIEGSMLVPGGATEAGPDVVVGAGIEWSLDHDVYVFTDPVFPTYAGTVHYDIDIGDDYLEVAIHTNLLPQVLWEVYYQLPGVFEGLVVGFDGAAPGIAGADISFGGVGPSGPIGDWNLWEASYPALEAWVDSMSMAWDDPARVYTSGANSLRFNTQGIAWALDPSGQQFMTLRADLTFVPAPGALAVLGLAGLASRRRR